ncbi:unnamed protein product [Cylicocyclus nassatus]|uniref:Uncharacterized protein n=1 Tax=Cylicocyclus nassatus TaxID=53992 RepID=A0AA36GI26_CYLNA|nr:unnamed protein product [Cylicocyclus nassatus]
MKRTRLKEMREETQKLADSSNKLADSVNSTISAWESSVESSKEMLSQEFMSLIIPVLKLKQMPTIKGYGQQANALQKSIDVRKKEIEETFAYLREIGEATGAQDIEIFDIDKIKDNIDQLKDTMQGIGDIEFERFFGDNGLITLYDQDLKKLDEINEAYEESARLIDKVAKAKEQYYNGDYEGAQKTIDSIASVNDAIIENANSSSDEIREAYKNKLEEALTAYEKAKSPKMLPKMELKPETNGL